MTRLLAGSFALLAVLAISARPAHAQGQPRAASAPNMQSIATALGVTCDDCHGGRGRGAGPAVTVSGKPRFEVAREMIAMTADLNARVQAATGKEAASATRVECITCHRGVMIPRQLRDIMLETAVQKGPEAAVAQYRDLRSRYYGGQSYDFREQTLLDVVDRLTQGFPAAAIALADLNLEFNPRSARSYLAKGIAQTRRPATTADAIESFKKALEITPDDGVVQGWLIQTQQFVRPAR